MVAGSLTHVLVCVFRPLRASRCILTVVQWLLRQACSLDPTLNLANMMRVNPGASGAAAVFSWAQSIVKVQLSLCCTAMHKTLARIHIK